jgi:hypothetical protein
MGIIIGYGDGGLYPERNATLAEAAVILYRLLETALEDTDPL